MELGNLLKINLKICLVSKKFLISILTFILISIMFSVNYTSNKDVYMLMEVILPIVGVVIFCDTPKMEQAVKLNEMFYLTRINKSIVFFMKVIVNVIAGIILFCVGFLLIYVKFVFLNKGNSNLNFFNMLSLFLITELFLGSIAIAITSITNNIKIALGGGLFSYWIFYEIIKDNSSFTPFGMYFNFQGDTLLISKILCLLAAFILIVISDLVLRKTKRL